jgi:formylmethanofuran dehydrogenase subunit A
MRQKGRIKIGADADVPVFDPARVIDQATYEKPAQYAAGFEYVMVGSTLVIPQGKLREEVAPGDSCPVSSVGPPPVATELLDYGTSESYPATAGRRS